MCEKTIDFSALALPMPPVFFLFLPPSQDHDAVSSEEHQNSRQVLVPQELPVPDF